MICTFRGWVKMKCFNVEPIIHSHIEDVLPEEHPLAFDTIYCGKCKVMVHAGNNECMRTWVETEFGNYCSGCFKFGEVMEFLEVALK